MYATNQLGHIGWSASYSTMTHPDNASNAFPITQVDLRGAPFIPVLQNLYDSQDIYYGMRLQARHHAADCLASQEHTHMSGAAGADQGEALHSHEADVLPDTEGASASKKTTHAREHQASHLHHQTSGDFMKDLLRHGNADADSNDNTFMDWVYPPPEASPARSFVENTMRWGSDSTFDRETRGAQRRVRVKHMTQFQLQLMPDDEEDDEAEEEEAEEDQEEQDGQDRDGDAEYLPSAGSRSSKAPSPASSFRKKTDYAGRNTPKKTHIASTPTCAAGSSTASRPSIGHRKRLTIEQKRSNHIRHEKKRRGLIRDRFHDLTELVPELQGGTWSRSKILLKAVEYLQDLLEKNEALQEELDALKATKQDIQRGLPPTSGLMLPGQGQQSSRRVK